MTEFLLILYNIIGEHQSGLVTVEDAPLALRVAANDSQTVCIGVGSQHKVGVEFVAQLHAQRHGLRVFRVRRNHGWEIAVDDHLLLHHVDVLEAPSAQGSRDNHTTRSVQWRINDAEVFLTVNHLLVHQCLMHSVQIVDVHLTADNLDEVIVGRELHLVNRHLVHLVDDARVVWSQHLSTIVPVCLVAVVLAWVVAGGDVHTCLSTQLTDGERNFRRGAQALEEISLDAVGREDISHRLSKQTRIIAAVMTHHHTKILLARECLKDVVGKALSGHTHDVLVHAVGTCTHDAAQTARTKFQILIERIDESRLVFCIEHSLHFCLSLGIESRREPLLCLSRTLFNQFVVHNFIYNFYIYDFQSIYSINLHILFLSITHPIRHTNKKFRFVAKITQKSESRIMFSFFFHFSQNPYKTTNNHSYSHWQNIILVTQGKQACNSPTLPMTSMFIPPLIFLIHSWHTFTPQKTDVPHVG